MRSLEQRKLAVETLVKFDHSHADTIAELGYPNRHSLYNRWKDYQECGEVRPGKTHQAAQVHPGDEAGGRGALPRARQEPGSHHARPRVPEEQGSPGILDRRARPGAEEEQAGNRAPQGEDVSGSVKVNTSA